MDFSALTEYLDSIPSFGAPGVDCIVTKEGKTVCRHFAGLADRENGIPMNGEELFYLYSTSKVITCTAALQLYERGRFLITDPVGEYLPEFNDMMVNRCLPDGTVTVEPAKNPITIGDLFSMSSGLDYDLNAPAIRRVVDRDPQASTREIVRAIAEEPLCFEPGTRFHYSLSHDVLGGLIEVWSGKRLGEYLKENIFEPLGIKNIGFGHGEDVLRRMMKQYLYEDDRKEAVLIPLSNEYILSDSYESGGAGLISNVEDYGKFLTAMANGGNAPDGTHILGQRTIDLMRTARITPAQIVEAGWNHFPGYGYGLGVRTMVDRAAGGSNGPVGEFGWGGAAGTYALIDPESCIAMFYAQHMRNCLEPVIHRRLRNILYSIV